ncbi:MAG: ZIP family metal transporter [Cytophagaceae bacterium]
MSAFIPAIGVFFLPGIHKTRFRGLLNFSGAYLFAVTVTHLIPELFHEGENPRLLGVFILFGFFFQMILEYFSSGVEHGHMHLHNHGEGEQLHLPSSLIISISIHAFLEGTLLTHPSEFHAEEDVSTLLFGLMLHKIPEAIALSAVLLAVMKNRTIAIVLLTFFSLASPVGLVLAHHLHHANILGEGWIYFLFAVVAGNFLYIATTIFFETSPDHRFKANKLIISFLGAGAAVLAEYLLS